jgi:CheY-like chemotaxis protein
LSNAIKFTDEGRVEVRATLLSDEGERVRVRLEVEDTGIGITEADLPHIFDAFGRGDRAHREARGGVGLGLAIAQSQARRMGGELGVVTEPGEGSTFHLELVLAPADEGAPEREEESPLEALRRPDGSPLRVLLAEDNAVNRKVGQRYLEHLGCEVAVVEDGEQALEWLEDHPVDVVLLDCRMPKVDGWEVASRLRAREDALSTLPLLAFTAHTGDEVGVRCREVGMDDAILKPVSLASLREKLAPRGSHDDDDS